MKRYLRFGEIPRSERSINFLKLTMDQVDAFSDALDLAGYDAAIESVPDDAFEVGVSAFEIGEDGLVVLANLRNIAEFCTRICQEEPAYVVTSEEAGHGNGGEPLLRHVTVLEHVEIDKRAAQEYAIEIMKKSFRTAIYEGGPCNGEVYVHYPIDPERPSAQAKEETYLCGWKFEEPVEGFDTSLGIQGRR